MLWVEPDLILLKKFCDKFCLKMFSYVVKNMRLRLALIILECVGQTFNLKILDHFVISSECLALIKTTFFCSA